MDKKYVIAGVVCVVAWFAFSAGKAEYRAIRLRIELTQTKLDQVADESEKAISDIRKVIASIVSRFTSEMESQVNHIADTIIERETKQLKPENKPTEPEVKPVPVAITPTIIMHSGPNCGPCIAWKQHSKPSWQNAGWKVQVNEETNTNRGWPWFEIVDITGLRFEVDGALTNDKFLFAQRKATYEH